MSSTGASSAPTSSPSATTSSPTSSPTSGSGCKCGLEKTSRIVGGSEVNPANKYPWMAALVRDGNQFCGGTLVASKYVISAAHCMTEGSSTPDFQIVLGEHDLTSTGEGSLTEDVIDVASFTNHE